MGSVMVAGVAYFLHSRGGAPVEPPPEMLIYVPIVAIAGALLAIFPIRTWLMRTADPIGRQNILLIGWAVGDAAALAGCVYYLLTHDSRFAITGIFVLLACMILLPIRGRE
jgi:hypothetical protein